MVMWYLTAHLTNSLWHSDTVWHHKSEPTLDQVMICCLQCCVLVAYTGSYLHGCTVIYIMLLATFIRKKMSLSKWQVPCLSSQWVMDGFFLIPAAQTYIYMFESYDFTAFCLLDSLCQDQSGLCISYQLESIGRIPKQEIYSLYLLLHI